MRSLYVKEKMQHVRQSGDSFLLDAPAMTLPGPSNLTLGFSVKTRQFHVVLALSDDGQVVPSDSIVQNAIDVSCYTSLGDALSNMAQPQSWMLMWGRRGANISCRDGDLYIASRQWVLVRADRLDSSKCQEFCGTVLVLPEASMSPQDRSLFARHAEDGELDSGWARLLGAYIQGLDAQTLQSLGDGECGWSLLEHQLMDLLRRALLEREDSVRFWNRRDDIENVQLRGEVLFQRVCAWLESNYADPEISSELVAKHFNVSSRYIQTLFAKYGDGLTFVSFVREARLRRAQEILVSRQYDHQTISQVCWSCGFSDSVYFGKIFREYFGVTPGQARRNARDPAAGNELVSFRSPGGSVTLTTSSHLAATLP